MSDDHAAAPDPRAELKREAAEAALQEVQDGMRLGLGTGSTARFVIEGVGRLVAQGLRVTAVATSEASVRLAQQYAIPLTDLTPAGLDLAIDGADEVDPTGGLIKGGGGALLREKLVASAARRFVVVVDETKQVAQLGNHFKVPVEIVRWGWERTAAQLEAYHPTLRRTPDGALFVTDNGNLILDCATGPMDQPLAVHRQMKSLVGVVETGLFIGIARRALVATTGGVKSVEFDDPHGHGLK
ncbi:MAG: ribose-5-phosphate isomerase RpiA [Herpetosiphonaceae bacterium]|nr:ribose-5-phosphate isomerase RpiA [Herpetosiphonaceae bacterium]